MQAGAVDPEALDLGSQALVGAVLALAGLGLVPVAVAAARHVFPARVVFFARWGFSHAVLAMLAALLLPLAVQPFVGEDPGFLPLLNATLGVQAGLVALLAWFSARTHPDLVEAVGLQRRHAGRAVLAGLLVFVMLLPGVLGMGLLWPWVVESTGGTFAPQEVLLGFGELDGLELVWAVVVAVFLIPFCEEFVFRGWLQPLLCQNLSEVGGVVVTSVLFAGLHGDSAFGPIFALSWILGAVMLRTHRLWAPWAMHAAFNGINLTLFLAVPEARELLQ